MSVGFPRGPRPIFQKSPRDKADSHGRSDCGRPALGVRKTLKEPGGAGGQHETDGPLPPETAEDSSRNRRRQADEQQQNVRLMRAGPGHRDTAKRRAAL